MVADHPNCPAPRVSPEEDKRRRSAANAEAPPPKPEPKIVKLAMELATAREALASAIQAAEYHNGRAREAREKLTKLSAEFDVAVTEFRAEISAP